MDSYIRGKCAEKRSSDRFGASSVSVETGEAYVARTTWAVALATVSLEFAVLIAGVEFVRVVREKHAHLVGVKFHRGPEQVAAVIAGVLTRADPVEKVNGVFAIALVRVDRSHTGSGVFDFHHASRAFQSSFELTVYCHHIYYVKPHLLNNYPIET
uniref:Uncharacterized protein n=1 Tax=Haloferax volcanii (strain ATCC 29605 / DSM 3757 / JCM 8879 / NBRC 14742 / NCIMB 2012 / VKM B-1768 / DS2) TaxID=309800 RepID=D4H0B4_HALVD